MKKNEEYLGSDRDTPRPELGKRERSGLKFVNKVSLIDPAIIGTIGRSTPIDAVNVIEGTIDRE